MAGYSPEFSTRRAILRQIGLGAFALGTGGARAADVRLLLPSNPSQ